MDVEEAPYSPVPEQLMEQAVMPEEPEDPAVVPEEPEEDEDAEEAEMESEEGEDEALLSRAQRLISKITVAQENPNPRHLHALASMLEAQESRNQFYSQYLLPKISHMGYQMKMFRKMT